MTNHNTQKPCAIPFTQSGSSPPASPTLQTLAIHAGQGPDPATGSILTPIHQTATFAQPELGETTSPDGHTYSRCSNPTVSALEANLAGLEGVPHALAFKTGLAAITNLLFTVLQAGDHVIAGEVSYGGTVRLLRDLFVRFGVSCTFLDVTDASAVAGAIQANTRLLFVETPANPTLAVCDLSALGNIARENGVLFAVDNTFLTSVIQPVFCHGAHVAILSTTKYVEGHDSTTGGALLTDHPELFDRLQLTRSATGSIQAPFDAWLTLRGLKTLPLRLKQHSDSARFLAEQLLEDSRVKAVHYPTLPSDPGHRVARRQQNAGGGILSFELDSKAVRPFLSALKLTTLAENLGAVETLITHPATMTHAQLSVAERSRLGIAPGLLRLSVGLEDPADILADLQTALEASHILEVQA
ncbi:MAG: PLP-dependent aspartate aminotransferase family protein [Planctomycetota bacterium]|nr:PLP-dependent aspartate aminotransferase family protein [Planctomycetota bacterium]